MTIPRTCLWLLVVWGLSACSSDPATTPDTGVATDSGTSGDTGGAGACTAQVVIGFFSDPDCTTPLAFGDSTRTYDTTMACFGWSGASAAGENSVTNFQCFQDRLCYTQHPGTLDCVGGMVTNKEARTDVCVLDTTSGSGSAIYARILSGTEGCPPAPAGFECPVSAPGAGTDGIAECRTAP